MSGSSSPASLVALTPAALGIDINTTLGASFVGLILSAVLYGVTAMQSITYFESSSRDSKYMKSLIGFLWFLDSFHLICMSHTMYTYLITDFENLLAASKPTWSFQTMILISMVSDLLVLLCYCHRLWVVSKKNIWLALPPTFVSFIATGLGAAIGVIGFTFKSIFELSKISWLLYAGFSTAILVDFWIALWLCFFLARNRTGFRKTDKKITVLMAYIVNTGLLTSVCALCVLVTYAAMPSNYIFIAFFESYSKLYFNALLAMLNARGKLSEASGSGSGSGSGKGEALHMYRLPRFMGRGAGSSGTGNTSSTGQTSISRGYSTDLVRAADGHIMVNISMETEYRNDDTKMLSGKKADKLLPILPV